MPAASHSIVWLVATAGIAGLVNLTEYSSSSAMRLTLDLDPSVAGANVLVRLRRSVDGHTVCEIEDEPMFASEQTMLDFLFADAPEDEGEPV